MVFTPKIWVDGSLGGTPITAAELNRMEQGIMGAQGGGLNVPEMFGAVGNGTTDDTSAMQSAINADVPLFLRPGATYLTSTLTLRSGTTFLGGHPGGYVQSGQTALAGSLVSKIKLKAGTNAPLMTAAADVSHVHVRNVELDGNRANQTADANLINLADSAGTPREAQFRFENCYIHDARGSALYVGLYRLNVAFYNSVFFDIYGTGSLPALLVKGDDFNISGSLIGNTHSCEGLAIYASTYRILTTETFNTDLAALHLAGPQGFVAGCTIDRSQKEGIYIDTNTTQVDISSTVLHSNSLLTNAGYNHISMASGSQVTLNGVRFGPTDSSTGTTNKPNYCVSMADATALAVAGAGGVYQTPGATAQTDIYNRPPATYAITTTTAPSAGGAGALPATPAGYERRMINGTVRSIPYY